MKKSKSVKWLTLHIIAYTSITMFCWYLLLIFYDIDTSFYNFAVGFILVFATHWVTDYVTSKITSKLYAKGDYHNFFVVIGFDAVLHYLQLFTIYNYIILNY